MRFQNSHKILCANGKIYITLCRISNLPRFAFWKSMATSYDQNKNIKPSEEELKWVEIRKKPDLLSSDVTDSIYVKNPFVPIGMLATAAALTYGLICLKRGDSKKQQLMMRCRVGAQGFTIAAVMIGMLIFFARLYSMKRGYWLRSSN